MELPTRNVAGSPISVSNPAELLMIAVTTIGPTKSTSSSFVMRMMMGRAGSPWWHSEETRRARTPAQPPQQEALAAALRREQEPDADLLEDARRLQGAGHHHPAEEQRQRTAGRLDSAFRMSCRVKIPKMINVLTPSMAATAMSITLMAIATITPAKTAKMTICCRSIKNSSRVSQGI